MRHTHLITCAVLLLCTITRGQVVTLQNDTLLIGVLPDCGGRLVQFQHVDGQNLLDSPPSLWQTSDATRWQPVKGHVIWVGPQSRWHDKPPTNWPPDLALTMGRYAILDHEPHRITMQSMHGETWGLQLTKQYTLVGDTLQILITACNITDHNVTWTCGPTPVGSVMVLVMSRWALIARSNCTLQPVIP